MSFNNSQKESSPLILILRLPTYTYLLTTADSSPAHRFCFTVKPSFINRRRA
jgi:hypothetical protein